MKRRKVCHGWYSTVKKVERRMFHLGESNNHRRLHELPPRRRIKI